MASKSTSFVDVLASEDHVGTEVIRSAEDIAKQVGSEGNRAVKCDRRNGH